MTLNFHGERSFHVGTLIALANGWTGHFYEGSNQGGFMKRWAIIAVGALAAWGVAAPGYAQSTLSKELTTVTGPDNTDPVAQGAGRPTRYEFTIKYISQGGPPVSILDTMPIEFDTVMAQGGNCRPLVIQPSGDGTTRLRCELPAKTNADIQITFQTRTQGGPLKEQGNRFEPVECTVDGFLSLNDGAVAVGHGGQPVAGPTPPMSVAIDGCPR